MNLFISTFITVPPGHPAATYIQVRYCTYKKNKLFATYSLTIGSVIDPLE
ncbi:MAG: hypothetical protein OEZ33_00875 [Gammaproteobacteria bacterium]|nr:hypothetical protein [Gammaproteobacteria bacterium]